MRITHTFAVLEVTAAAFREIGDKLLEAGYTQAILEYHGEKLINMHGIALKSDGATDLEIPKPGELLVGYDAASKMVTIVHPYLRPDSNGVGYIHFTPQEARALATLLTQKASEVEAK